MSSRWRNIFFLFGLAAIAVMVATLSSGWNDIVRLAASAGVWLPVIVLLWIPIYLMNAVSWYLLIRNGQPVAVPFVQVLKMTVTGFALNYTTPFGLMGGEPYRIMELSGYVGSGKAVSSVILYVMTHICSHFCFWLTAIGLYVTFHCLGVERYAIDGWLGVVLGIMTLLFLTVCWLFSLGFRYGFVIRVFGILRRIPLVRGWAERFLNRHLDQLQLIDSQISLRESGHHAPLLSALVIEYLARVLGCVEYWILLRLIQPEVTFLDSFIIMAFSSFFSNLIFFLPMQLGSREGGVAMAVAGLSMPAASGLTTALATRLRELVWIIIGVGIMKIGNKHNENDKGAAD